MRMVKEKQLEKWRKMVLVVVGGGEHTLRILASDPRRSSDQLGKGCLKMVAILMTVLIAFLMIHYCFR